MPTVLRWGPYRVYSYSHEPNEPRHVHVDRNERTAKLWLDPVCVCRSQGFSPHELRRIEAMIEDRAEDLRRAWDGYFRA